MAGSNLQALRISFLVQAFRSMFHFNCALIFSVKSEHFCFCHRFIFKMFPISLSPDKVHQNVDRTNVIYGSLFPNARNVYSTHGQLDPWRTMGVQEDINEHSPTVILPREYLKG